MLDKFYQKLWSIPEKYRKIIQKCGDILQIAIPLSLVITLLIIQDWYTLELFVMYFIIAMLIQVLLKALFNNPRPREIQSTDNPHLDLDWSPDEGNSFCSGHTLSAMTGALFWFYLSNIVGIIALILAIFTAFSRLVARAHWLRDVLVASLISLILFIISL